MDDTSRRIDSGPSMGKPPEAQGPIRRAFGAPRDVGRAALLVLVTAAVWGCLTALGQQVLPDDLRSLANAAGPWFGVVMGAILIARPRLALAVVLGAVGLMVMNEAYGVVSAWRGVAYGGGLTSLWDLIALVVGPAAGIAATWLRSSRPVLVALGVAAPSAVLVGEGVYGLTVIADTTSPVFWVIELATGLGVIAIGASRVRSVVPVGVIVAASVVGAGLFYVAYRSL